MLLGMNDIGAPAAEKPNYFKSNGFEKELAICGGLVRQEDAIATSNFTKWANVT